MEQPEALVQLARLLREPRLRSATPSEARAAVERALPDLVAGLGDEAAASDDVTDRDSALSYLDARLDFFADLLSSEQKARVRDAFRSKIEQW